MQLHRGHRYFKVECPFCHALPGSYCTTLGSADHHWPVLAKDGLHSSRKREAERQFPIVVQEMDRFAPAPTPTASTPGSPEEVTMTVTRMRPVTDMRIVRIPKGYTYVAHGRQPVPGEYYLWLTEDLTMPVDEKGRLYKPHYCYAGLSDAALNARPADHYLILAKQIVKVYTFRETGEVRVPKKGEWYVSREDIFLATTTDPYATCAFPILKRTVTTEEVK